MDDLALARAIHVIAVLFWIGGVGFVTWVIMPALRASERPTDRPCTVSSDRGTFCMAGAHLGHAGRCERAVADLPRGYVEPFCRDTLLVDASDGGVVGRVRADAVRAGALGVAPPHDPIGHSRS